MKAMIYKEYGSTDVLERAEVEKPTPQDHEVLVKVHAAALNAGDIYRVTGKPFLVRMMAGGILKPKLQKLGSDIAGTVEAVGKNVTQFQPGDRVIGDLSEDGSGGFAEYVCASENTLALKPENISFEAAAAVPMAAVTALQALRDQGEIKPGQKVLINGASGGVGTFAVQLAKAYGCEVTAVCSTRNLALVRSIGADHVIDYTQEDFTRNGQQYDLIIAVNGYRSLDDYKRALSPEGRYICVGGTMRQIFESMLLGPWKTMAGNKKIGTLAAKPNQSDLIYIKELLETGKIIPVVDRCYPLEAAAEAFRYLAEGHAKGKIVITVENSNTSH